MLRVYFTLLLIRVCFDCSPTRHTKYRSTKLPHIAIPCIALDAGRIFAREGRRPLAMPRRPAPESPEAARVGGPPEELLAPTPSRPRPRPVARDAAGLGGSRGHRRKDASCSMLRGSDGPCARLLLQESAGRRTRAYGRSALESHCIVSHDIIPLFSLRNRSSTSVRRFFAPLIRMTRRPKRWQIR